MHKKQIINDGGPVLAGILVFLVLVYQRGFEVGDSMIIGAITFSCLVVLFRLIDLKQQIKQSGDSLRTELSEHIDTRITRVLERLEGRIGGR